MQFFKLFYDTKPTEGYCIKPIKKISNWNTKCCIMFFATWILRKNIFQFTIQNFSNLILLIYSQRESLITQFN